MPSELIENESKVPICNVCNDNHWADMGNRKNAKCANCGSLERTRAMMLFLKRYKPSLSGCKVLHLAPEKGLAKYIIDQTGADNYRAIDLEPSNFSFCSVEAFDLCKDIGSLEPNSFDLIVHSHVIEHVPCNYAAVLKGLHKALKADGIHLCCIPIMKGFFAEDCGVLPEEERTKKFGQHDHIRRFGDKDIHHSLGMIFKIPEDYDLEKEFNAAKIAHFNIPDHAIKGYNPSSILVLRKEDLIE